MQKNYKIINVKKRYWILKLKEISYGCSMAQGGILNASTENLETQKNPRTVHIKHIRLQGDKNNNKMERLNGEIRDREKIVRGLKKKDSPLLKGYQLYHNYVRPHMALDGKTPAEMCGIKIKGDNKWKTLIQNASKK